jgi:hypothetical protein
LEREREDAAEAHGDHVGAVVDRPVVALATDT